MICDHPECTGKHSTALPWDQVCPESLKRRRARHLKRKAMIRAGTWKSSRPAILPPCCMDAGGKVCPQHKQQQSYSYDAARGPYGASRRGAGDLLALLFDGDPQRRGHNIGFRTSRNPDSDWPDNAEDRAQERAIAEWMATVA